MGYGPAYVSLGLQLHICAAESSMGMVIGDVTPASRYYLVQGMAYLHENITHY